MYDITDEEEANLPLPDNWLRIVDINGYITYKDTRLNVETEEHPYIHRALMAARKIPLPTGWFVKEMIQSDGEIDIFYCNSQFGISGFDPPHLRQCLSSILLRDGYRIASQKIIENTSKLTMIPNSNMDIQYGKSGDSMFQTSERSDSSGTNEKYQKITSLNPLIDSSLLQKQNSFLRDAPVVSHVTVSKNNYDGRGTNAINNNTNIIASNHLDESEEVDNTMNHQGNNILLIQLLLLLYFNNLFCIYMLYFICRWWN
jgi:hypothetical protein